MTPKKRIWATLDDYAMPGAGVECVGRSMANGFFFEALMRHGTFDEYHFFLSNGAHRTGFMEQHGALLAELGVAPKIRLWDRLDLPHALGHIEYTVFHQSDHIAWFNALCRLRNSLGSSVPVTSFIHSVSYQRHMTTYLEMLHCGVTQNDAIICSSQCGKHVVQNCLTSLATQMNLAPASLRFEVIPLGIGQGIRTVDKTEARQRLGLSPQETIALCFGRFSDFDKMDLFPLLQAMAKVVPEGSSRRLVLAGALHEPSYLEMTQAWTRAMGLLDHVTFVTDPSDDAKSDLYSAADFFVSLADNVQETFGLTLVEAMQAGLPLLVSDFDGYRELCDDSVGVRVPTCWSPIETFHDAQPIMDDRTLHRLVAQQTSVDIPALTQGLDTLFSDTEARRRMGQAARKRFDTHFTHERIIRTLEMLWNDLKLGYVPVETKPDPMAMRLFDTFGHYVTFNLTPQAQVKATEFGSRLVHAQHHYPLLAGMGDMVDWPTVVGLVTAAVEPVTLNTLETASSLPQWKTQYIIAWMLKHDLLSLERAK
ncbi:MAG: glycosyltransferase family 4 protein [Phycisphaeraceae bacterium]|nr:glycosyltransferase family 4 protein [Phycisphaeraceae bacterium]